MHYGDKPEGAGSTGLRPSFVKEFVSSGISVKDFLILAKRNPEAAIIIGEQIRTLIESGASQAEVTKFFRNQAKVSSGVADLVGESKDWKNDLARVRSELPKKN